MSEEIVEKAEKKQQVTKKILSKEIQQKQKSMVYLGPDIPGAKQYTIFNNGLPDVLKEKMKEHPFFYALVVPVEKMAQANAELAQEGSALHVLFEKANEK
ncbi:MAG: hypothetical protein K1V96_04300 [Lachnospiraceae bacterium]